MVRRRWTFGGLVGMGGIWSIPFNLGPSVNTDRDELHPFFDFDGNLFFTSDGHDGEGGLDIFAATNDGGGDEWSLVGNIGIPYNTPEDDFPNTKLMEDIICQSLTAKPGVAAIQVVDPGTGEPIPDVIVKFDLVVMRNTPLFKYGPVLDRLYGKEGSPSEPEAFVKVTDEEGEVSVAVYSPGQYMVWAQKEGYKSEQLTPTDVDLLRGYVISLGHNPPKAWYTKLTVCAVEDSGPAPVPKATIRLTNLRTGEAIELESDESGCVNIQIDCKDNYEITAFGDTILESATIQLTDYDEECESGEVRREIQCKKRD